MDISQQLQKTALFKEVELADLETLVTRMHRESYAPGAVIFRAGDLGDAMFIIQSGRIRIFMNDADNNEITLTHYGQNEIFGELSPIDQRPRSASATAAEALDVLVLDRADFLNLLNERPQIGLAMMRSLAQRLRNTTTYLEEFKPTRFEAPTVDQGEALRREASPEVARLIDERMALSEPIKPDVLSDSSIRILAKLDSLETGPVAAIIESDASKPASLGMGIFDRIAASQENTNEKPDHKDETNPS